MRGSGTSPGPPRIGQRLLRWIYGEELYDEISGDMEEIFEKRKESHGKLFASIRYNTDAALSIRNYDLKFKNRSVKTHNNTLSMFENYVKVTFRNISKNKIYSALNILGLSLGIAACLFILQYVSYERSYDTFHRDYQDIYRVMYQVYRGENPEPEIDCAAAVPRVGPFMKEKFPEVMDFARAYPISRVVEYNNTLFREKRIHIADPAFLKIFSFPLIAGNVETALTEPNTVVISETAAQKYFGSENPMGKKVRMNGEHTMEVTGVAQDVPDNSHIKFDFLISFETLNNNTRRDDGTIPSETSWGWYDYNTYVRLQPGTDYKDFDRRFAEALYEERGEDFEKYNFKAAFPLQPIEEIHLYSNLLQESEPEEQGDGDAVFFLTIIAFFILLIAWINYINLSTARSIERAKEVGVRKTMGAYRKQLIYQFLAESFVLNFLATIIGLIIVAVSIRYFNSLTNSVLSLDFLVKPEFWLVFSGIFLGGSVVAGIYPAFVLSSFRPASVLKGNLSGDKFGNQLRRVLVVFQFSASVTLIAGTVIVYQQLAHMRNTDLGFDMTETLVIKGPQVFGVDSLYESTLRTFKTELRQKSEIVNVTAGSNVPGDEIFWTNGIKKHSDSQDKFKIIYNAGVDYDYFDTYGIKILAGRNYGPTFTTDTGSLILNKAAISYLGFESVESAINQKVTFWGQPKTVVGVVDDYNQMSVKSSVSPIAFPLVKRARSFFTLKLNAASGYQDAFEVAKNTYDQFFPGNPFDYFFLDEFYNRQYENEQTFSRVFVLFAGLAIVVACLGLFGLSSFSALKRTKEIGIRKALGANISSIVMLLSKEFVVLVLIGNLIAWPVVYFLMNNWLNNFASRIDIGLWVFLVAGLLVIMIALITVGYKTIVTAKSNPVGALRYE